MMTLEEVWESLRQDTEIKSTMEEVEKSYKLFKKIENLIVADLEAKLAERTEQLKIALKDFNDIQEENDKLAQQLAEERKKVVQEIKKLVIESTCYDTEEEVRNHLYDMSASEVLEILDQVEKGEMI